MRLVLGVLIFALGLAAGVVGSGLAAQQQRTTDITRLMKKDLEGCEGKEVLVSVLSAGPGTSGYHYHPGESFTYVLEGTQTREAKGEETTTSCPGGFIYDGPMQVHRTENTTSVKLLIVRVLEKGKPESIRSEQ
jgi:quercetin dioxygenase-like cupin family protein